MKRSALILIIIAVALIAVGVSYYLTSKNNKMSVPPEISSGTPPPVTPQNATSSFTTTTPSNLPGFNQSLSFGGITISYSSPEFGLATNQTQLLVHSYIPPCDQGFDYCIYYDASTYKGTNFESAGIGIKNVTGSFPTAGACITAPPDGYTGVSSTVPTATSPAYSVSVFNNLGNAAAGHYATDNVYRLAYNGKCYEFDARIGESQYANYPAGSIKLFAATDYNTLKSALSKIIGTITLSSGGRVVFPF